MRRMDEARTQERFTCAPGLKLEAHERLTQVHFDNIASRLNRLEELLERLERRLWLAVYGVAGVILAQVFQGLMGAVP